MRYNSVHTGAYLLLICIFSRVKYVLSQGSFPPLVNVGENKPMSTSPEFGTCGFNPDTGELQRSAYCRSSALQDSVISCTLDYCVQDCRSRTNTPSPRILLSPTSCVTPDGVNVRPGSEPGSQSYIFRDNPNCYITPVLSTVGNNGRFTLSVWLRPDTVNDGAVIERRTSENTLIYAIMVSSTLVTFDYRTATGLKFMTIDVNSFATAQWTHLVVQVFSTKISFFVDGLEIDGTAYHTANLVGQLVDQTDAQTRVGQRLNGANQYVGRMQDLFFYQETLTNREIVELNSGEFPVLHLESDCRCPDSHPRVNPLTDRYCLQNGEPDTSPNQQERLNEDAHPLAFANDGDLGSYWVSAFSDDMILYLDLSNGQFQVFYVVLQFYSPQPTSLSISRKYNDTDDWEFWQFFADDCMTQYGMPNNGPLDTPTSVNCLQFKTDPPVPYSNANITFQLLSPEPVPRPGYNNFYNTPELLQFVKASQIQIRLQDHYHVSSQRHRYYGIDEVTISARCECNGHAVSCDLSVDPYVCNCLTGSRTMGDHCDECLPLYNDKPFRYGDQTNAYNCKPCNCYNHADSCVYDETQDPFPNDHSRGGGGVCVNCQHNTRGRFCDECLDGYFRDPTIPLDSPDVCNGCDCFGGGTIGTSPDCEPLGGQCQCKPNVGGRRCDTCERGYFNLQPSNPDGCESCACQTDGTINGDISCDDAGICTCKTNVIGDKCDRCNYGYHNLTSGNPDGCQSCACNPDGSSSVFCNPDNGVCQCKSSVQGDKCDECRDGYYGLGPTGCTACSCDGSGTEPGTFCDKLTGSCTCKTYVQGSQCDQCAPDFYGLSASNPQGCSPCACNTAGTIGGATTCDATNGQCTCKSLVTGRSCNQCTQNSWGLDAANPEGCVTCGCDPTGTQTGSDGQVLSCDQNSGQCPCLTSRVGRQCDGCNTGTYKPPDNSNGCLLCNCHPTGSISTTCDALTGQCVCKSVENGVSGRRCDSCLPEFWNFDPNTGTCAICDCNPAGSVNTTCESSLGQCECKELVTGRQCDTCKSGSSNLDPNNPQGCSKAPSQQPAPIYQVISPYALLLSWDAPDEPNGRILRYNLHRDNAMVYSGITNGDPLSTQQYEDSGLTPYTQYVYYVEAVNEAGSVASPLLPARTPDAIPSGFDVLTISNIGSRTADFTWFKPTDINADITQYILTSVTPSKPSPPTQHYTGLDLSYVAIDLIPFSNYTFRLTVCTTDGCGQGQAELAYTDMAPPEGVMPPNATAVSPTDMYIEWDHPTEANGIITHYELFMRGLPGPDGNPDPPETRIFYPAGWYNPRPTTSPLEDPAVPPETNFTQTGLEPFTQYEFRVTAMNTAGTTGSVWALARTMEDYPLSIPAPIVTGVTSNGLNISWIQPPDDEIRGFVVLYNLFQITASNDPFAPPEQEKLVYSGSADQRYYIMTGLTPYSSHVFRLEACNSIGCVKSDRATGTTLEDVPAGMRPPYVDGFNSSTITVAWNSPRQPNGPAPSYKAHRMVTAFNAAPPLVEKGSRFPGGGYYLFSNMLLPSSAYTGIELKFRVTRPEPSIPVSSLLVFAASDGEQEEYIVIQMRDGRPWFVFDPQGGAAAAAPSNDGGRMYDDGVWHKVLVTRDGNRGFITVDDVYTGSATASTSNTIIGLTSGLYVGGLPPDFIIRRPDTGNTEVIRNTFMGCMRDIRIEKVHLPVPYWEDLDWDSSLDERNVVPSWQGCPIQLQGGGHFLGGGYAVLPTETFVGGNSFVISLGVRTEINSGIILFVYGDAGSYMVLQIVNRNLQLIVTTSSGSSLTLTTSGITLCNGQWHAIIITKVANQLTLSVQGSTPISGSLTSGSLILSSSIYVGGIPQESIAIEFVEGAGLELMSGFGGCLKDLEFDGTKADFTQQSVMLANVYSDGCPESDGSGSTCIDNSATVVYNGLVKSFTDTQLRMFTEYLYQVSAINNAGSVLSDWAVGRTRDGPPSGVTPPTDPVSITGYIIQVSWQRPSGNTGLLTHYILTAYDQNRQGEMVQQRFEDTSPGEYRGNITGTIPYSNYAMTLTACTSGGCTESGSVNVQTIQEAPDGVNPPDAIAKTGTSLSLEWNEPDMPNGILTLYRLSMDGIEIYEGIQAQHMESGLSVFTGYRFIVTACTSVGCSDSPVVTIVTAQLPPTSVAPPTLLVRGPTSMEAQWTEPSEPNGVLERYVLFVSEVSGEVGLEVYNTSDLFRDYIITELTAGSLYYVSVAACNGGGCTTSLQSMARTEESIPEGVQEPNVIATSPFVLDVSWGPPSEPNGIITSYSLIQNGIKIQDGTAMSRTVTGLTPWSLHVFRVEACTSKGCSFGPEAAARTQEAPPQGDITLMVIVDDARAVNARWTAPASPNGFMYYEVMFTGLYYVDPDNNNYNTVTETQSLYNGTDAGMLITITGLIPYSSYDVRVLGYNTKGNLLSDMQSVTMPAANPDGVLPPSLYALSSTSIQAQWQEPGRNNAPGNPTFQLQFRLARDYGAEEDVFDNPTRVTTYIKSALSAYTEYEFRVIAINNYGQTEGDWNAQFTLEDVPGPVDAPMASTINPYALQVTWEYPEAPNGIISTIKLFQNDVLRATLPGNMSSYEADNLTPYSGYYFKIEMCNSVGCTASPNSQIYTTPQAPPSGQAPPTLLSNTPTSIVITWVTPTSPNGPLIGYEIERRPKGSSAVTPVVSVGPGGPLSYLDRSPSIVPYTTYEYRIRVSNPVGNTNSLWEEVTTKAAPPGGVAAPTIVILDHETVEVIWDPPAQSNGEIISYTIHMPDPRIYIGNPNITSYAVGGLIPYTDYAVTVEACTPGGCTESSPTPAQTDPYFPEGQDPPKGDPITQSYISVIWNPPSRPNGPNIRYDLYRIKIRQPLETGIVLSLGFPELIYQGLDTTYQDVGLTTFTTYQYQVTVYNSVGPTTSNTSEEVTTLAGIPRKSGSITAVTLDHISVLLNWTTPSLQDLQGEVLYYYIDYTWDSGYVSLTYLPGIEGDIIDTLDPNTRYEFRQTIFNGAYNITSPTALAETMDGAPSGFDAPIIYVISPSALRVAWLAPSQPNGEVTEYSVYKDDIQEVTLPPTTLSYVLSNLQPYTIYAIQVKVCTVYDCLMSNITYTTTLEAPPTGISPPNLRVLGSQDTDINWAAPSEPNGIIQQYEVLRQSVITCDNEVIEPNDPDAEVCSYLECSITESICGTDCYSGNQVCCDGTLHDYVPSYECCDTNYLPSRANPSDVCCGGRFHPFQPNHECCQSQYVQVLPDQICCPDPEEDRVAVGFGDMCCGGVPFESNGPQICCQGRFYDKNQGLCCSGDLFIAFDAFHDGFNSKCCGSSVIDANQVCCEENGEGIGYEPDLSMQCCGSEFVDPDISLCCTTDAGSAKAHIYASPEDKAAANENCCGLQNIGPSQSCCNSVGYNPATHVCADRSTTAQGGCGVGVLCPISQAPSAYCDRCDFDPNTHICGSVEGYFVLPSPNPTGNPGDPDGKCRSGLISIFVGGPNNYNYQDSGLSPYTVYEYTIAVHNSAGSANSEFSIATTHEDIPDGVQAPEWSVESGVLDTIKLTWDQPDYPNGEISTYILRRDNIEIYRGDAVKYDDDNGIQPFQHYTYVLGACTAIGCASSPPVIAATLQAPPDNLYDPTIVAVDAYSLRINWQEPGLPNGVIQLYHVMLIGKEEPIYTANPQTFTYLHTGLDPYTSYEYALTACTAAGCTTSATVGSTTLQAPPQGVSAPVHVTVSATILEIYWEEPLTPNGVITEYRLFRYDTLIFVGNSEARLYTDTGLSPNSRYEYRIEVATIAGSTPSSVYVCQTPQNAPEGIPAPSLTVLSATHISASWTPPAIPNGNIVHYAVVLQSGSAEQFTRSAGLSDSITIDRLTAYTDYDVRVQACNDGGCGVGPKTYAQTLEAPPEQQGEPSLVSTGSSVVEVSWEPPTKPNGVITRYYIYRRAHDTSQELLVYLDTEDERNFKDAGGGLQPFSLYEYRVRAENSQTYVDGPWAEVRTLEAPPQGIAQPSVQAVSPYAVSASWQHPSSPNGVISAYRIEYQQVSNDPTLTHPIIPAATVNGHILDATFYGLAPYTPYNVRIVAINGAGETQGTWAQITTQEGVPADIDVFSVEQSDDGQSLLLRWDVPGEPNGEITEYRIYEDIYLVTPIYVGLNREYLFRRLDPYTQYVIVLEACTSIGCGRGDPQTVTTAEIPPGNQAPPTLGYVNATVVQLLWKPPITPNGQITKYDIIRRTSSVSTRRRRDTDNSPFTETRIIYTEYDTDHDEFDYADDTLYPYQLYEYRIRAVNSKGSVESDWVSVQTEQAPPIGVYPPLLSHIPGNPSSLLIQWSEPGQANGIIQGYLLQQNDSAPFSLPADGMLQFTDTSLRAFTVYSYAITACSGGGCTRSDPSSIRTLETAPAEVNPPNPKAIGSSQIEVTWNSPSLDYGEIVRFDLKMDDVIVYTGLNLQYVITALTPYQEYGFTLVACTLGGCTESIPAYERPFEAAPTGMDKPDLRALSSTAVEASWTKPAQPNGQITRYELRRDGKLIYDGTAERFQDFGESGRGLTPGQEYTYVVTAFNSAGSSISPPETVTTSSSSPAGLDAPLLQTLSSTSILATWQPPRFPNGDIQNYTLYVDSAVVYSGKLFSFEVSNLLYFTTYEFRIEACTLSGCALSERVEEGTLEHAPSGQLAPTLTPLSDTSGVASGIAAEWGPPQNENGIILGYELFRRRVYRTTGDRSDPVLLINGTVTRYTDMDQSLVPDETYEYMVTSKNSVDKTASAWALVRMLEAPPQDLLAPLITDLEATRLSVNILDPGQPNGAISSHTVIRNDTEIITMTGTSYKDKDLEPFTYYSYAIKYCTSGGCTTSDTTIIQTKQDTPSGLSPPVVREIDVTWAHVTWEYPQDSNGIISSFEIQMRRGCPLPTQPFPQPCAERPFRLIYVGLQLSHNATGLFPYTKYDFKVVAYNDEGQAESPVTQQDTLSTAPEYIPESSPTINSNTSAGVYTIAWTNSFRLYGELVEYQLVENGDKVYSGIATVVERRLDVAKYELMVTCRTKVGQVNYPTIIFEPTDGGVKPALPQTQWYTSVWFIAIMALIGVILLFIIVAIFLSRLSKKQPYERERQPLPPRQRKGQFAFNGCKYADTESILDPIPNAISRSASMHSLGQNAFANPSFINAAPSSRPPSRGLDTSDKLRYIEDEEGFMEKSFVQLPVQLPKGDSGMYDDDALTQASIPYSYTKEQTMFTDTHL